MSGHQILIILKAVCILALPFGILCANYFYINNPKRKHRLAELGFGPNNEWAGSKRIDFFAANYQFASMPLAAYILKVIKTFGIERDTVGLLTPHLNVNGNFLRVLEEFPLYSKVTLLIDVIGIIALVWFG